MNPFATHHQGARLTVEIDPHASFIGLYPGHSDLNPHWLHELHLDLGPESITLHYPDAYRPDEPGLTAWDAADLAVEHLADLLCVHPAALDGLADLIRSAILTQIAAGAMSLPFCDPESTPSLHAA